LNLHYIRAAIIEAVGIKLTLEEVRDLLVELNLITPSRAKRAIFTGYGDLYGDKFEEEKIVVIKDLLDEAILEEDFE
jgi:hypothetical protein